MLEKNGTPTGSVKEASVDEKGVAKEATPVFIKTEQDKITEAAIEAQKQVKPTGK